MRKTVSQGIGRFFVVGCGNMGSSLIRGLNRAMPAVPMYCVDQNSTKINGLNVEIPRLTTFESIEAAATLFWPKNAKRSAGLTDVIIMCIKPQDLDSVGEKVRKYLPAEGVLVVTLLAGVTMAEVSACLGFKGPVIRAMPNIAAMVGAAATGMSANEVATDSDRDMAGKVFAAVGTQVWVKEELLDAVTGLSGSGPAFIYIVIEALTDGGVRMGLPRDVAAALATQTVLGSAMLVRSTGLHPAVLRDQVTTPGGTTISGIHELESHGIRAMMMNAVAIATERSHTLRKARSQKK